MSTRIKSDFDEIVVVDADSEGVLLSLVHGVQELGEVVLRPSQAERLAAELLAYANGDHLLPPDAVRPVRIVEGTPTPRSMADIEADITRGEIDSLRQEIE